jgi:HD superfamily phosphohydrolase
MELAGRVFDVVTHPDNLTDAIRRSFPEIAQQQQLEYWRRAVRMASLCHDMGHLPFSHAAEKELLPEGWDHEKLTRQIVHSSEMCAIWRTITPPLRPEDVEKLAVGPRKARDLQFSPWEAILSEIIVGDAFGVDRMDYLLRDSHHLGVAYGRFDHFRLIDTLRILPSSNEEGAPPALGVEEGGLKSAEALLLGRYYMYSQVYFHPVRRIYDIHLMDFLKAWLPGGKFPTSVEEHLMRTDNEVNAAILQATLDDTQKGHDPARRITRHEHFKLLYQRSPEDVRINPEAGLAVHEACKRKFGLENVRRDHYSQPREATRFPVLLRDDKVASSEDVSDVLRSLPLVSIDFIPINPSLLKDAKGWLMKERTDIITPSQVETA